jgi:peptidoglycan/LPS O-acetylase OafA/YrhL
MINKQLRRLFELDVLRGLAALGVVIFHYTSQYNSVYKHSSELNFYFSYGRHGVEFFFILSGFVILMSMERIKSSLDFLVGRFARLYPSYWIGVILSSIVVTLSQLPEEQISLTNILINFTMFQGFFNVPNVDGVYWTLYIELCFYILMLSLFRSKLLKYIEPIITGWLVVALFFCIKTYAARWGWFADGIDFDSKALQVNMNLINQTVNQAGFIDNLSNTLRNILILKYAHLFILGIMLYKQYTKGFTLYRWAVIVVCVLAQRFAYSHEQSWETTIFVAGFTLLILLSMQGYIKWINFKPLIFLGSISYSLYLIHQNLGYAIIRMLYTYNIHPYISIIIATILSLVIAVGMTFIIEQPALKFIKNKYKQSQMAVKT